MSNLNIILLYFIIFSLIPILLLYKRSQNLIYNYIITFPIMLLLISLPSLLDLNHKINKITYYILIISILCIFVFISIKNKFIFMRQLLNLTIFNALIILFFYSYHSLSIKYNQFTPDTYVYEFIARSMYSEYGLQHLSEGLLLQRGLILPVLWTFFSPAFKPIYLPLYLIILLFITYVYFSSIYFYKTKILINKFFGYFLASTSFLIFLFSLQGFYLMFYVTTHTIIAICVIIYFGLINQIVNKKMKITKLHIFTLFSCIYIFSFIRPEGIFLSFFAIVYMIIKLDLNKKVTLLFINSYLILSLFWFFSISYLFNGKLSYYLFLTFFILLFILNFFLFFLFEYIKLYLKNIQVILILFLITVSLIYSHNLIFSSLHTCFRSIFLNEGGLGLVPYLVIFLPIFFKFSKKYKNNSLILVSVCGIFLTYSIYPILNQNAWFCDSSGWGGSLPRAWIHFVPLFGIGVVEAYFSSYRDKKSNSNKLIS